LGEPMREDFPPARTMAAACAMGADGKAPNRREEAGEVSAEPSAA